MNKYTMRALFALLTMLAVAGCAAEETAQNTVTGTLTTTPAPTAASTSPESVAASTPTPPPATSPSPTPPPSTTPSPTPTPPPSTTPSPSPTPSPTPAPAVSLEISETHTYDTSFGSYLIGEVENTGSAPVRFVKVSAIFYKADGTVDSTDFTYTYRDVIPPGERSPFAVTYDNEDGAISTWKLTVTGDRTSTPVPSGLRIQGDNAAIGSFGYYEIAGEVVNDGDETAEFVKVIASLYDATGKIVGADFTFTSPSDIPAGESAGFTVSYNTDYGEPATYALWVE